IGERFMRKFLLALALVLFHATQAHAAVVFGTVSSVENRLEKVGGKYRRTLSVDLVSFTGLHTSISVYTQKTSGPTLDAISSCAGIAAQLKISGGYLNISVPDDSITDGQGGTVSLDSMKSATEFGCSF